MPYLTIESFKKLTGLKDFKDEDFNRYLTKASAVLDNVTNHFYQFHDIDEDKIVFRVKQFRLALCSQVLYFSELGADTFESINGAPQNISMGRTSVSYTSRFNAGGENESKQLLAEDVFIYLEGTGLLSRGVKSW